MRVMTFNIQHCHEWLENRINVPIFAKTIKEYKADFCGLNEVRGFGALPGYTDQTNAIGNEIGYNRYFGQVIRVGGLGPYGNAFVTKYDIISAKTVKIPDTTDRTEKSNYESRGVLSAVIDVEGTSVHFLVCHMGLSKAEQKCAVETLCPIIDESDMPLVLMGDFNTTPDSGVLDPLFERLYNVDDVSVNPGAYTYASYDPKVKIDYILYKGLNCKKSETVREIVSDHFPIIADFEL